MGSTLKYQSVHICYGFTEMVEAISQLDRPIDIKEFLHELRPSIEEYIDEIRLKASEKEPDQNWVRTQLNTVTIFEGHTDILSPYRTCRLVTYPEFWSDDSFVSFEINRWFDSSLYTEIRMNVHGDITSVIVGGNHNINRTVFTLIFKNGICTRITGIDYETGYRKGPYAKFCEHGHLKKLGYYDEEESLNLVFIDE